MSKRARGVKKGVHNIAFWPILPFLSLPKVGITNLVMKNVLLTCPHFLNDLLDLEHSQWPIGLLSTSPCLPHHHPMAFQRLRHFIFTFPGGQDA
jgi:hypothetical protein